MATGLGAATIGMLLLSSCELRKRDMETLNVSLYVTEPLLSEGGVVFVLPNRMEPRDFEAKYSKELKAARENRPDSGPVQLQFSGKLSANVTFVHFDAPGGDYVYRFLIDPQLAAGRKSLLEKHISVGGAGSVYLDAQTKEPVNFDVSMTHYIKGSRITEGVARGVGDYSTSFVINNSECESYENTMICNGDAKVLSEVIIKINRQNKASAQ